MKHVLKEKNMIVVATKFSEVKSGMNETLNIYFC